MKPLPQNDSSMNVETLMNDLGSLLEETKFSEAATLAIAILSSHVEDRSRVCSFFVEVLLMSLFPYFSSKELCSKSTITKLQAYVLSNIDEGLYIEGYG